MNFESKRIFLEEIPSSNSLIQSLNMNQDETFLLIYDKCLEKLFPQFIDGYSLKYGVESGETLKNLNEFPNHVKNLLYLLREVSPKKLTVVAAGGGTVGDFSGFFASCFKRGVNLIHMPTTWLAAIDSSHGGKTALNVGGIKNQIGSFYPARAIVLVENVFKTLSVETMTSGVGELLKIGFINSPQILKELHANPTRELEFSKFWRLLPLAIDGKMKIVLEDPFEQGTIRQKLNLGHTLGHAIESKYRIDHGLAVLQGMAFALYWSREKKLMEMSYFEQCRELIQKYLDTEDLNSAAAYKFDESELIDLLAQDKKRTQKDQINFIFMTGPSEVSVQTVTIGDLVKEAKRQGYL